MRINSRIAAGILVLGLLALITTASIRTVFAADTDSAAAKAATDGTDTLDASVSEAAQEESADIKDVTFSTYRGKDIDDTYHSFIGTDGITYLFLPSDANMGRVTVKCSAKMQSTTLGKIGEDGMTLAGDFTSQPAYIVLEDGTRVTLMCAQSSLPSLSLRLQDADLQDIHDDEDTELTFALESVILTDPMESAHDFNLKGHAEIKGRGNSSWSFYDKKGYQIKLENSREILGMGKAKKWVLLANSSDSTLMRNKLVFDTARALDIGYAPQCKYADLWIDGDYRGVYLIAEKAEIGKNRLNLTSGHGILAEFDNAFYYQEDYFKDINENCWALKDYQTEDASEDFLNFQRKVNKLAEALNEHHPWEEVAAMIDEEQFARFYLTAEFFLNEELATTSFYWYSDGPDDELHLGPIWDFDTCMADGDPADKYYVWHNGYLKRLLMYDEYLDLLESNYEKCREIFELAPTTMDLLHIKMGASAEMNYHRFDVLGRPDVKKHMFYATYSENLENQKQWLRDRLDLFSIDGICAELTDYFLIVKVSDDQSVATLSVRTRKDLKSLQFYVQTEAAGGADRKKYEAARDENGIWTCEVNLIDFNQKGEYTVEAFVNGTNKNPDATATFTLDSLPTVSYVDDGVDYSAAFDSDYYADRYPEAEKAAAGNPSLLFQHFLEKGMKDRLQGSPEFNVDYYMKENPDLVKKYGEDYPAYYRHYCEYGKAEGRRGANKQDAS
ncbi:MAG: CotH kinase family protein [Lachnospiraceae bacterium]|nr:CotH kinase family protein [Lachnospiraceae bacterium]